MKYTAIDNDDADDCSISIIVPVYNAAPYLKKCVESLLNQTFDRWEAIFINDGSIDDSGQIVSEYALSDSRIKIIHKENGGVSSARNLGLSVAQAPYICMLDADDYLTSNALQTLYDTIVRYNCGMVCCLMNRVYSDGRNEVEVSMFESGEHPAYPENVFSFEMRAPWAKIYRKSIIEKYKISFPEGISICEDDVFVVSYWSHIQTFAMVNEALYNYLQPETSALHRAIAGKMPYNVYERTLDVPLLIYKHIMSHINETSDLRLWGEILVRYYFYLSIWMQECCHNSSCAKALRKYERANIFVFQRGVGFITVFFIRAIAYVRLAAKNTIRKFLKYFNRCKRRSLDFLRFENHANK